jgi:hypothetical protein
LSPWVRLRAQREPRDSTALPDWEREERARRLLEDMREREREREREGSESGDLNSTLCLPSGKGVGCTLYVSLCDSEQVQEEPVRVFVYTHLWSLKATLSEMSWCPRGFLFWSVLSGITYIQ